LLVVNASGERVNMNWERQTRVGEADTSGERIVILQIIIHIVILELAVLPGPTQLLFSYCN